MASVRLVAARTAGVTVVMLAIGLYGLRISPQDVALTAVGIPDPVQTAEPVTPVPVPVPGQVAARFTADFTGRSTTAPTGPRLRGSQLTPPVVTSRIVVTIRRIPFTSRSVSDPSLERGLRKVTRRGHSGYQERIYRYVARDGVVVKRTLLSTRITRLPVAELVHVGR